MTRNGNGWTYAAGLALVVGAIAGGCATTTPRPIDVTAVAPCPAEDGPGMTGPAPCVFDGGPDVTSSAYGTRWVYYAADDACDLRYVQDARLIHCVQRSDWTGGVGSGEGRTN